MGEGYVRPPLVAREPASRRAAVWRTRAVAAVIVLVLAGLLFLLLRSHAPGDSQNPGFGLGRAPAAVNGG